MKLPLALLILLTFLPVQAQVTLEFWTLSLAPMFNTYIESLIATYEREHPGVRVNWTDHSAETLGFSLLGAIANDNAPDVVNINVPMLLDYAERGILLPLNSRLDEPERYFGGMLSSFEIAALQYGLPWYVAPPIVAYNSDLFARAGLNPAAPPTAVQELFDAARTIKDNTGFYGFMPNIISQGMLYRFLEAGLPVLSGDGYSAVFNSPEHVALLEQYVELFQQDYFPEDALLRGYIGAVELYSAGRLGMLITGPQFLSRIREENLDVYLKTRIAPYPLDRGGVIHAPIMGLIIPAGSSHPDEAFRFASHVTSDESQLAFSRIVTVFPSTVGAAADPFFTQLPPNPMPEDYARRVDARQLQHARDLTMVLPNPVDLFNNFKENMDAAFYGYKTPQEALDDAVRFWNSRL